MSKKYTFDYYGTGKGESFTVTTDDNGEIIDSSETFIKSSIGRPSNTIGLLQKRYYNQNYTIEEEDGPADKKSDVSNGEMEITKIDPDKRQFFGWAYVMYDKDGVAQIDKSGEFMDDPDELEAGAYEFVIKSRSAGDRHGRNEDGSMHIPVGTMIESMVFTPEKIAKMGIPPGTLPTGWWVGFKVESDEVWKEIKAGNRPMLSIHGAAMKVET